MKNKRSKALKVFLQLVASLCCALVLFACGDGKKPMEKTVELQIIDAAVTVRGFEWGASVTDTTFEFAGNVSGVDKDTFIVKTQSSDRVALNAFVSDKDGNPVNTPAKYVTVNYETKYKQGNPFNGSNWAKNILLVVTVNKDFKIDDAVCKKGETFTYKADGKACKTPQLENWRKDTYKYTGGVGEIILGRASWAPEGALSDGGKNPLVIWLHGAGEGGAELDLPLLGNEVTALTTENDINVQHYFTDNTCAGAYVLAVQTPTMWKDVGGGVNNTTIPGDGKQLSVYTDALYGAITSFVDANPDIDQNRIYLGGCSNGGYMTMNMMFEYGDYFAAYYPICEGYLDNKISDDMIEQCKDKKIWFVQAADDTTIEPRLCMIPTYLRFLDAGAENMHITLFDHVRGTDDPNPSMSADGFYDGHSVWIELFNDNVKTQFDNSLITGKEYIVPSNCTVQGNIWQWLSGQSK